MIRETVQCSNCWSRHVQTVAPTPVAVTCTHYDCNVCCCRVF